MGYIPENARWYLADVVLEHVIEGERRNLVMINVQLIEASSPQEAHKKALERGREQQFEYLNTDGMQVRVKFRGLRELNVIHDDLEDGAEISYEELVAVPESKLKGLVTPKRELGVFAPRRPRRGGPNTMPLEVMRELEAAGFTRAELKGQSGSVRRTRSASPRRGRRAKGVATRKRSSVARGR